MLKRFWILPLIFLIDRLSKIIVEANFSYPGQSFSVIPNILKFNYLRNTGAAFGMLQGQTFLLTFAALLSLICVLYILYKQPRMSEWMRVSLWLILAGALGNLYDRITLGYVVDFIDLSFLRFFVFNIADASISVGAFIMGCCIVFIKNPMDQLQKGEADGTNSR